MRYDADNAPDSQEWLELHPNAIAIIFGEV